VLYIPGRGFGMLIGGDHLGDLSVDGRLLHTWFKISLLVHDAA
jgi:hypothetical protein